MVSTNRLLATFFFVLLIAGTLKTHWLGEARAQALPGGSSAATGANVARTRHNLSSSAQSRRITSGNTVTTEEVVRETAGGPIEICVYCHTPHGGANNDARKPLWNRADSSATYSGYSSGSLNASDLDMSNLATPSKLCLSCHDGTLAIGAVANSPGSGTGSAISMSGLGSTTPTPTGTMPYGRNLGNERHGFTRRLGTDLRNDHPISFTFNTALANADGELRDPASSTSPSKIANRATGVNFPLTDNKVQCTTCHDPHRNTQKFLLKNRLAQDPAYPANAPERRQTSWTDWQFNDAYDQICLGCHTRLGKVWGVSAHANSEVANETYSSGPAALRDFPDNTKVWQAGCLNCHDTHTAPGSRYLLREGVKNALDTSSLTAGTIGYAASFRPGDDTSSVTNYNTLSAQENTCYQCHSSTAVITPTALSATEGVPNIEFEFSSRTYRMPITNNDQGDPGTSNTHEEHDISDRNGGESQTKLGYGVQANRHVECTDCHNPHRVVKADTFLGAALAGGDTTRRTHVPARGSTGAEGNIAGGPLRGSWGVEPSYTAFGQTTVTSSSAWMSAPENPNFEVKKGDPGSASTLPIGTIGTNATPYLTREYQLCFKCHSSYANGPDAADFPSLKGAANGRGGTPTGTNSMTRYTNVAAEYAVRATDPPTTGTDQGEGGTNSGTVCGGGNCAPTGGSWDNFSANATTVNHRSWHPVVFPTGRSATERGKGTCSSGPCTPETNFKTPFQTKMGTQTMHCSDCHGANGSWTEGSGANLSAVQGPHGSNNPFLLRGTWNPNTDRPDNPDLGAGVRPGQLCVNCHTVHVDRTQSGWGSTDPEGHTTREHARNCGRCHIAVPHGWKNKAFLVNLNCIGREGGATSDCADSPTSPLTYPPYYVDARLKIRTWDASGQWQETSCGRRSGTPLSGKDWMSSPGVCEN